MLKEHAKILQVFHSAGEIVGRKKLQKMIYIAKKMSFPFQERFQFHFFGPYSEELTLRVEELCNMGFLQETMEKKGGYHQY
ncbi:MAG: YwgA family protein, partial [Bacillales bacterium]